MTDQPRTITELYDTDPLSLSDQDIAALVADYRGKRQQFLLGAKQAGKVVPPKVPTADTEKAKDLLSSLGLLPKAKS